MCMCMCMCMCMHHLPHQVMVIMEFEGEEEVPSPRSLTLAWT